MKKEVGYQHVIKNVFNTYNYYNDNKLLGEDYEDQISYKILYMNNSVKFKRNIEDQTVVYFNDNHKTRNYHLNMQQYWILSEIFTRDKNIGLYLRRLHKYLKSNNGYIFIYNKKHHEMYNKSNLLLSEKDTTIHGLSP